MLANFAGSLVSSFLLGSLIGTLGALLIGRLVTGQLFWIWISIAVLSLILALREFGWLHFPIPQLSRQTPKQWFDSSNPIIVAWWWGIDLGSGLTTYVTFSGYWLLVLVAFSNGSLLYGGFILSFFGLGRALAVWLPPTITSSLKNACYMPKFQNVLLESRPYLHKWHGYGLFGLTFALIVHLIILR